MKWHWCTLSWCEHHSRQHRKLYNTKDVKKRFIDRFVTILTLLMPSAESQWWMTCNGWKNMNFGKSSSDKQIYLQTMTFIVSTKEFSVSDLILLKMFSDKNTNIFASLLLSQPIKSYCETQWKGRAKGWLRKVPLRSFYRL